MAPNKSSNLILLVVGVALVVYGHPGLRSEVAKLIPGVAPSAPSVPEPDASAKTAVAPVTAALKGHPAEAVILAAFFRDFATVAQKFPQRFDSIAAMETHISASTKLLDELKNINVDGINAAVGNALTAMLGSDEAKKLDSGAVVRALNALSWACGKAG